MSVNRDMAVQTITWSHDIATAERDVLHAIMDAAVTAIEVGDHPTTASIRVAARRAVQAAVGAISGKLVGVYTASCRRVERTLLQLLPVQVVEARVETAGVVTLDPAAVGARVQRLMKKGSWASDVAFITKKSEAMAVAVYEKSMRNGDTPAVIERNLESKLGSGRNWNRWVRTEVQRFNNAGIADTSAANSDLVGQVQSLATMDTRTCPACAALDGKVHDVNKAPKYPLHDNCRCTLSPIVRGADELRKFGLNINPKLERVLDGQASDRLSYDQWLSSVDEDTQRRALGDARFELYKAGTPIQKFVDDAGKTLAVEDLLSKTASKTLAVRSDVLDAETAVPVTVTAAPIESMGVIKTRASVKRRASPRGG